MRLAQQIFRALRSRQTSPPRPRPALELLEKREQPSATMPTLGTAGQFAVLGLQGTLIGDLNATVNGAEGVSRDGYVLNQRPSTVNGNVEEYSKNEYGGRGALTGSVQTNASLLKQADSDAATASAAAAALAPTQTFGSIRKATTIQGNGGLNVININGDINASVTLVGGPNDVFVVNVNGDLNLDGRSSLALSGGVTANDVLFNFVGRHGGGISVGRNSSVSGTLLALRYDVDVEGVVNGEVIAGGLFVSLDNKAMVNQNSFNGSGATSTPGISGYVYDDLNGDGNMDPGDPGQSGVVVTLTGTTASGATVTLTATTNASGFYSFTGLSAGTYSLQRTPPSGYFNGGDTVGTVNNVLDGAVQSDGSIGQINYQSSGVGSGYNFAELPVPID